MDNACPRCGEARGLTLGDYVYSLTCTACDQTVTWLLPETAKVIRLALAAKAL